LDATAAGFQNSLKAKGITDVRYGLVGFGSTTQQDFANSFVVNTSGDELFGSNAQVASIISDPQIIHSVGIVEDGWDAIEHAIAEYRFRDGAIPILVLEG
jgi:hypothetical protein